MSLQLGVQVAGVEADVGDGGGRLGMVDRELVGIEVVARFGAGVIELLACFPVGGEGASGVERDATFGRVQVNAKTTGPANADGVRWGDFCS